MPTLAPIAPLAAAEPSAARTGERTYALTLEYDGTAFSGWQRQPGRRTVEGVLLEALAALGGERPRLTAAGRTDAGAHAHGQVVGCTLGSGWLPERLREALNARLPGDVVVVDAAVAPPGFHARFDAVARSYRYLVAPRAPRRAVARQFAWCVRGGLDVDAMARAAERLRGTHDLAAFGRSPRPGGSTVRTIHEVTVRRTPVASPDPAGACVVVIEVRADAFLSGMVRAIAAALVAVGTGRMTGAQLGDLLDGRAQDAAAPAPAPPSGLHQWRVSYPHGWFRADGEPAAAPAAAPAGPQGGRP